MTWRDNINKYTYRAVINVFEGSNTFDFFGLAGIRAFGRVAVGSIVLV